MPKVYVFVVVFGAMTSAAWAATIFVTLYRHLSPLVVKLLGA